MNLKHIFAILLTTFSLLLVFSSTLLAQNEPGEPADDSGTEGQAAPLIPGVQSDDACPGYISNSIISAKMEFYINLERQLESPELTSDRIFDLFEDYSLLRRRMQNFARTVPGDSRRDNARIQNQIISCQTLVRGQFVEINQVFDLYLSKSANLKRNYILTERYDSINEKLDATQVDLQSLNQDLKTFSNNFLCFTDYCLQN